MSVLHFLRGCAEIIYEAFYKPGALQKRFEAGWTPKNAGEQRRFLDIILATDIQKKPIQQSVNMFAFVTISHAVAVTVALKFVLLDWLLVLCVMLGICSAAVLLSLVRVHLGLIFVLITGLMAGVFVLSAHDGNQAREFVSQAAIEKYIAIVHGIALSWKVTLAAISVLPVTYIASQRSPVLPLLIWVWGTYLGIESLDNKVAIVIFVVSSLLVLMVGVLNKEEGSDRSITYALLALTLFAIYAHVRIYFDVQMMVSAYIKIAICGVSLVAAFGLLCCSFLLLPDSSMDRISNSGRWVVAILFLPWLILLNAFCGRLAYDLIYAHSVYREVSFTVLIASSYLLGHVAGSMKSWFWRSLVVSALAGVFLSRLGVRVGWLFLVGLLGAFRVVPWLVMALRTTYVWARCRAAGRRAGAKMAGWLRSLPPYRDELIWLPLPFWGSILARAYAVDSALGQQAIADTAAMFPSSSAVRHAWVETVYDALLACTNVREVAALSPGLSWLPEDLARVSAATREMLPRTLVIARDLQAGLESSDPDHRRKALRDALEQLRDRVEPGLSTLARADRVPWQRVIAHWGKLLLAEMQSLTEILVIQDINNPYQAGLPLRCDTRERRKHPLYKGREDVRGAIVGALREHHRPALVLSGPWRIGKTSVLRNLPALLPGRTIPVFLDLQGPVTSSDGAFLYAVARSMAQEARTYQLSIVPPERHEFETSRREGLAGAARFFGLSPFEVFDRWLEDTLASLRGWEFLILLDEFEKLGEAIRDGRMSRQVLDELRHLMQHQEQLGFLFAGVQTLDDLGPDWSSYFVNVRMLRMDYLSRADSLELIEDPKSDHSLGLRYIEGAAQRIYAVTQGHPYLLQLVCSSVIELANEGRVRSVGSSLVEAAEKRSLERGEPYFRNLWNHSHGDSGQALLRRLAEHPDGLALELGDPTQKATVQWLVRYRVLVQREGRVRIEVPLFRQWVSERAPLE